MLKKTEKVIMIFVVTMLIVSMFAAATFAISYTAKGKSRTKTFKLSGGLYVFNIEHKGFSKFDLWLKDAKGKKITQLATGVGDYEGKKLVYLPEVKAPKPAPTKKKSGLKDDKILLAGLDTEMVANFDASSKLLAQATETPAETPAEATATPQVKESPKPKPAPPKKDKPGLPYYVEAAEADGAWSVKVTEPELKFEKREFKGKTNTQEVTELFKLDKGIYNFNIQHNGNMDFQVILYNSTAKKVIELAKTVGYFKEIKKITIAATGNYVMEIKATGEYSVKIVPAAK